MKYAYTAETPNMSRRPKPVRIRKTPAGRLAAALLTIAFVLAPASLTSAGARQMTLVYDGVGHVYQADPVTLVVNGSELTDLPMPPVILDGRTLAPVREIFESLGAAVDWRPDAREADISYQGNLLTLRIDDPVATLNGRYITMEVPPKIINDKTMIPVRFPAEALGFEVGWDGVSRTVTVTAPAAVSGAQITWSPVADDQSVPGVTVTDAPPVADSNLNELGTSITRSQPIGESGLAKDISTQDIPAEDHPKVKLTNLRVPQPGSPATYTVTADGPISKVVKMILPDNRLVLDFYNAEWGLQAQYKSDVPIVAQVRTGQNQLTPTMITRVVFDLRVGASYAVSVSGDRKSVTVSFERAEIQSVAFGTDASSDRVYITGNLRPGVDIYPMPNPDRIVIDMPLTTLDAPGAVPAAGRLVSAVDAEQLDANTARVTLSLTGAARYDLSYDGNTAVITVKDATVHNVSYDRNTHTLAISKAGGLSRQSVTETDLYSANSYVLTLPGDYSAIYGYGDYMIKDEYLDGVGVNSDNGMTSITVYEKQVFAYNITETKNAFLVTPVSPKEKYARIVVIDPGHGGGAPGAQGGGLTEKNLTLDISQRLMRLIEADGLIKAYATRTSDVNPDLFDRPVWGGRLGDMFVSIHMNSSESNFAANGTDVYYSSENNVTVNGFSSEKLAGVMLESITSGLGTTKRKVVDNPALVVLKNSTIPAVLCELGFLSNERDAANFGSADYRQKAAEAIYKGILQAFQAYTR
ncbi:MAG: N-acetylmuramoyl-L-alanine amidase family protein [Firmicutes bacterium]|nr:N-acetylmuramoyl-L-alanine amidase family protein [Bacillota bacterium]